MDRRRTVKEAIAERKGESVMGKRDKKPKAPSFLKKVKNFTTSMAKIALGGFETVPEEELQKRWDTCSGNKEKGIERCEKFTQNDGYSVCSLEKGGCGCQLSEDSTKYINKLLWAKSSCPIKKWLEYNTNKELNK